MHKRFSLIALTYADNCTYILHKNIYFPNIFLRVISTNNRAIINCLQQVND